MPRHLFIISLCLLFGVVPLRAADNEAVQTELKQLLLADEEALRAVERLMAENAAFAKEGAGLPRALLSTKVHGLVDPVREKYETFLQRHPDHVRGHLAYASFLGEFSETPKILEHLEKAIALAPDDAVVLNNVAKHHAEHGAPDKAFGLIQRALEKRPDEPTYLRNLAGIMLVFRDEAVKFFGLSDTAQAQSHAIRLYRRAVELQPDDFLLRTSLAQALYARSPFPEAEAAAAWEAALNLASTPLEREGVLIHLARVHIRGKNFTAARSRLDEVSAAELQAEKKKLLTELPRSMRNLPAKALFNLSTAPPKP